MLDERAGQAHAGEPSPRRRSRRDPGKNPRLRSRQAAPSHRRRRRGGRAAQARRARRCSRRPIIAANAPAAGRRRQGACGLQAPAGRRTAAGDLRQAHSSRSRRSNNNARLPGIGTGRMQTKRGMPHVPRSRLRRERASGARTGAACRRNVGLELPSRKPAPASPIELRLSRSNRDAGEARSSRVRARGAGKPAPPVFAPQSPRRTQRSKRKRPATAESSHGIGVLLVNLGTPDAAEPVAVRRYLKEFLTDRRVIETRRLAVEDGAQRHHPAAAVAPQSARLPEDLELAKRTNRRSRPSRARRRKSSPAFSSRSASTSSSTGRCATPAPRSSRGSKRSSPAAATAFWSCRSIRNIRRRRRRRCATRCSAS